MNKEEKKMHKVLSGRTFELDMSEFNPNINNMKSNILFYYKMTDFNGNPARELRNTLYETYCHEMDSLYDSAHVTDFMPISLWYLK